MNNFYKAIQDISYLSDESWQEFEKICSSQSFKKNEFILKQGAVCNGMYFISKGLARIFYYKDEKEISEWFAFDNSFCFSIISYFKRTPSSLIIQCLEDCEVITISHDGLKELRNKNFEVANLSFELVSRSLIMSQDRMAGIQFETALQRYEALLKLHSSMLQRVPLIYIASYLGVSAETLSRIRTQIH